MDKKIFARELHKKTGCGMLLCSDAYDYMIEHNGNEDMAIAYLKAKCFAVCYRGPFDEKVKKFMENNKNG